MRTRYREATGRSLSGFLDGTAAATGVRRGDYLARAWSARSTAGGHGLFVTDRAVILGDLCGVHVRELILGPLFVSARAARVSAI